MTDYKLIEEAVIAEILSKFPDELDADLCSGGNIDSVVQAVMAKNAEYACLLEFGGARRKKQEPYRGRVWEFNIVGVFMIRFTDEEEIEARLRNVVSKITTLFSEDHTLGKLVPLAEIETIDMPDAAEVVDMPFYWLVFNVSVTDKS